MDFGATSSMVTFTERVTMRVPEHRLMPSVMVAMRGTVGPAGMIRTHPGAQSGWPSQLICTGTSPVRLPAEAGADDILYLRTIEDALVLRGLLVPGADVVIVGAGWIGAEVATAAAAR